ncbi:glutaminase [Actinokineospora sp. NBRC 105648]|uniref:glutaminase n=1 Tax=Actinokineospora sp. NBRC 105648 TaxID=3032206 RepID=UPI0025578DA1|nr:glutaminase [Actinokineospora sp. NBRC 105648]
MREVLEDVHELVRSLVGQGRVADYIPALAEVEPRRFGLAVATLDGEVTGVGDYRVPFSVQSLAKVFALAAVLGADGDQIWGRVGREPSTHPFNSLVQLEIDRGVPRNPFLNAGALVTTDRLLTLTGDAAGALRGFLRAESGNPALDSDPRVADSELAHGHRNASLAHLIASYGNLENPVPEVLDHYVRGCALSASCADLALAGLFLARGGVGADGTPVLSREATKRLNATMLVCGMYDGAGEFAYRVGLPAKSGVGGGIIAVVPNRCVLCVWSPALDVCGNSVAGVAALEHLTARTGWSVF